MIINIPDRIIGIPQKG